MSFNTKYQTKWPLQTNAAFCIELTGLLFRHVCNDLTSWCQGDFFQKVYDVSSSHRWPSRVNTVYHISYGCVSLTFFIGKDTSKKVSDHTYWLYMSRPSPFLDITISINQQNLPLQSTTNKKQPVFANISLSYSVRARI